MRTFAAVRESLASLVCKTAVPAGSLRPLNLFLQLPAAPSAQHAAVAAATPPPGASRVADA